MFDYHRHLHRHHVSVLSDLYPCTVVKSLESGNIFEHQRISNERIPYRPAGIGQGKSDKQSNDERFHGYQRRRGDQRPSTIPRGIHDYRKRSRNLGAIIHPLPPLRLLSAEGPRSTPMFSYTWAEDHGIVERLMLA